MDAIGTTSLARVNDSSSHQFVVAAFLTRYPPISRRVYAYHLKAFYTWCESHGLDPLSTVRRAHIEAWARYLDEERGLKQSTIGGMIKVVCGFYKYAVLDGVLQVDPSAHVRRPRIEFVSTTNGLTLEEATAMLAAAEADGPVTDALMHLLLFNGLRIGETMAINVEHISTVGAHRVLFLPHRKGGKTGHLALPAPTIERVDAIIGNRKAGPLLLGYDGQRMNASAARRTVARLCRRCKITKRITPHSCRHSFVTLSLDAGVPERDIMASTAHSNPVMIGYYDRNRGALERSASYTLSAYVKGATAA